MTKCVILSWYYQSNHYLRDIVEEREVNFMGDSAMVGMTIKEGVEVVENGIELGDQVLDLVAKYNQTKDEKYYRELKLHMEEIDVIERTADVGLKLLDGAMGLIIKGVDARENYQAKKRLRKDEENKNELEMRLKYHDAALERGIEVNPEVISGFEHVWEKVSKEETKERLKKEPKDHGSKVKEGVFAECSIEMFDNQAGIIVNKETQEVVMLTSDNVFSCKLVKSKIRMMKKYYYYHITFHDGQKCLARMRKKYRDAIMGNLLGIDDMPIDETE